ncbi:hypothetical protein V6Z11_D06G216400 [Gossypium hirsutum]
MRKFPSWPSRSFQAQIWVQTFQKTNKKTRSDPETLRFLATNPRGWFPQPTTAALTRTKVKACGSCGVWLRREFTPETLEFLESILGHCIWAFVLYWFGLLLACL